MGLTNLNAIIEIVIANEEIKQIIKDSIEPDNIITPPMNISVVIKRDKLIIRIMNCQKTSTLTGTIEEIFKVVDLSYKTIESIKKEK